MILDYASGTPEQMTTSLMESVQRALGDSDRRLASIEDDLGQSMDWPHIECGSAPAVSVAAQDKGDVEVTFETPFETVPVVVASFVSKSTAWRFANSSMSVYDITTTGFKIRFFHGDDTANREPGYRWIAVEITKGPKMIRGPQGPAGPAGRDGKDGGGSGGSSDYTDLSNKPQINGTTLTGNKTSANLGLANAVHTHVTTDITDFPELADVATSGDYDDLENKPTLATVATSGDYDDLLNKPTLATVATSGDYDDLLNKPVIPDDEIFVAVANDTTHTSWTDIITAYNSGKRLFMKYTSDVGKVHWLTLVEMTTGRATFGRVGNKNNGGYNFYGFFYVYITSNNTYGIVAPDMVGLTAPQSITNKTYNGYTLGDACAKGVVSAVDSSGDLPTSDAVKTYVDAAIPTKTSDLTNDSGFITTETDPTVPAWAKASTKPSYTAAEVGAQETLVSGTNIKTINNQSLLGSGNISVGGGSGGTSDYDQLSNRPAINSTTLTGDQSSADLGLADAVHTHTKADITDYPTIQTLSPTYTRTSGSQNVTVSAYRWGPVVHVNMRYNRNARDSDNDMAKGKLSGLPAPVEHPVRAASYNGSTVGVLSWNTSSVNVRVNTETTTSTTTYMYFQLVYLTNN